jgi:hypothetical protein
LGLELEGFDLNKVLDVNFLLEELDKYYDRE